MSRKDGDYDWKNESAPQEIGRCTICISVSITVVILYIIWYVIFREDKKNNKKSDMLFEKLI